MEFFFIYIAEAHPTDGWQVRENLNEDVIYDQPKDEDQREAIASACVLNLKLSIPTLIDDMNNGTERDYVALPERLYLIDIDGRIVHRSGPGPFGFSTAKFESAIETYLRD